jgi:very-short-patch-repair endonuclease
MNPSTYIPDILWLNLVGEIPTREFRFHDKRRWRIDYAFVNYRIAVEIQGGIWMKKGGHTTGKGYRRDTEKLNALTLAGWRVLWYPPEAIDFKQIKELIEKIKNNC